MNRRLVALAAGVVLVAGCGFSSTPAARPAEVASTPAPAASPTAQTFNLPVGATLRVTGRTGVLEVTVTKVTAQKAGCKADADRSKAGTFVIVDVTARVVEGTASVNSLLFSLHTADGTKVDDFGGMFAGCPLLESGNDVPAGITRKGQIVYDVPASTGLTLEYQTPGSGTPVGSWKLG